MILHHQLNTAPVRASDALPTQQRFEQERRERLARIERLASAPRPAKAFTVRPFRAKPIVPPSPQRWDYYDPAPYETMDFGPRRPRQLTAREVIDQVAVKHGVSRADLSGHSRRAYIVAARREVAYRIRHEVLIKGRQPSYPEIARHIGHRDHTTILYHIRQYEAELARKAIA